MDREVCEKLYNAYFMRVYSYLIAISGDASLSEELAQETFFKALTTKSEYRSEADECTWLCAIAKNLYYDIMRKNKRFAEMPEYLEDGASIEQSVFDRDDTLKIHIILHSLKEPYREVFELRTFGELSFSEIGTVFGKTESWARVTYHRAKLQIQERMAK